MNRFESGQMPEGLHRVPDSQTHGGVVHTGSGNERVIVRLIEPRSLGPVTLTHNQGIDNNRVNNETELNALGCNINITKTLKEVKRFAKNAVITAANIQL